MAEQPPLVVLGAGGHAKVVVEIATALGRHVAGVIAPAGSGLVAGVPILGSDELLETPDFLTEHTFVLGIGNQPLRRRLFEQLEARDATFATLVHPSATVSASASFGEGTVVVAGAVINADARIGRHVVINTLASVDHDCTIGDNALISPHAALCGGVTCGDDVFIGTGAILVPGATIGARSFVAAGELIVGTIADDQRIASRSFQTRRDERQGGS